VSSVVFDEVDTVFFVGLASFTDVQTKTQGTYSSSKQNQCATEMLDVLKDYQGKKYNSYTQLENDAEEALQKYAENKFRNVHAIVIPPLGKPGENYTFRFPPDTASTMLLLKLYQKCGEDVFTRIVVDLTHGVNFIPTLCLKVAKLISEIMLIISKNIVDYFID